MFRNLLKPDSALMITMTQITDCIFLSLFWLLGCFPLVTAGASFAALYDSVYRAFRQGEKHSWQRFFHSFRQNWKAGLLPSVLFLAAAGAFAWGGVQLWNNAVYGNISWAVFSGGAFLMVVAVGVGSILFPMLSRFENPAGVLIANTLRLGLANLPLTAALGVLNTATVLLCMRYVFPLFFLPALSALISTLFIEPMFRPYMPEEETD